MMPTIVVKPVADRDLYVGWSSVVDNWVWAGDRVEALTMPDVDEARLARADETGTSALWGNPPREGAYDDNGFIVTNLSQIGFWWLPRANLAGYIDAMMADDETAAMAFLEVMPDDA